MHITQIRTITAFVSDVDHAKEFYVDTLGFDVRVDLELDDANRWLEVAPQKGETAIALHKPFPGGSAGQSRGVMLISADLDADCKALRAAGVDVHGQENVAWGRQATFADPDGNTFVLQVLTD